MIKTGAFSAAALAIPLAACSPSATEEPSDAAEAPEAVAQAEEGGVYTLSFANDAQPDGEPTVATFNEATGTVSVNDGRELPYQMDKEAGRFCADPEGEGDVCFTLEEMKFEVGHETRWESTHDESGSVTVTSVE